MRRVVSHLCEDCLSVVPNMDAMMSLGLYNRLALVKSRVITQEGNLLQSEIRLRLPRTLIVYVCLTLSY